MGMPIHRLSLQDFLAWEEQQPDRHEYHRGEVFARAGGRRSHGTVVANLIRRLGNQLDGSRCRAFSEAMKLQVADDTILYPDVFVTCDRADLATDSIFRSPSVVIEVLSPSTQAHDRGPKFALYRRVGSLREFVLVDPDARTVESFRRGADRLWVLHDLSDADVMDLPAIGCRVTLAELFDGVDPPADAPPPEERA